MKVIVVRNPDTEKNLEKAYEYLHHLLMKKAREMEQEKLVASQKEAI